MTAAPKPRRREGSQRGLLRRLRALPEPRRGWVLASVFDVLAAEEGRAERGEPSPVYGPDAARVAHWLADLGVGAGDDPIGFLLASHQILAARSRVYRAVLEQIADGADGAPGLARRAVGETP